MTGACVSSGVDTEVKSNVDFGAGDGNKEIWNFSMPV